MQLPVTLALLPSHGLAMVLAIAFGLTAAGLVATALPLAASLAGCLCLAGAAIVTIRRHALRGGRRAIVALTLGADGRLTFSRRDGSQAEARIDASTTVLPGLVVLLLNDGRRREALTLMDDALGADAHRQLRLWLKWRR